MPLNLTCLAFAYNYIFFKRVGITYWYRHDMQGKVKWWGINIPAEEDKLQRTNNVHEMT